MKIRFKCPVCEYTISIKEEHKPIGKNGKCKQCGNMVRLTADLIIKEEEYIEEKTSHVATTKKKQHNNEQETLNSILFSMQGRLDQGTYTFYRVWSFVVIFVIYFMYGRNATIDTVIVLPCVLMYLYAGICLDVKRLHDLNRSGLWLLLLWVLPIAYLYLFLTLGPERPKLQFEGNTNRNYQNASTNLQRQNCVSCGVSFIVNPSNIYNQENTCSKSCFHKKRTAGGGDLLEI